MKLYQFPHSAFRIPHGCVLAVTLLLLNSLLTMAIPPAGTGKKPGPKRSIKARPMVSLSAARATKLAVPCPNPPSPAQANGGLVIGCVAGERITVSSLPRLPTQNEVCWLHCGLQWNAPAGWNILKDPDNVNGFPSQGNPVYGGYGDSDIPMYIVPPSGVTRGLVGQVTIVAFYSECEAPYNTQSSADLWYGLPDITNPRVNGSPAQSYNTTSGSAELAVSSTGARQWTWTLENGNGSLQLYGNSDACRATVNSGVIRVRAQAVNRCGSGDSYTFYLAKSGSYGYRVAGNPAKDQLTVSFDDKAIVEDLLTSVALLDKNGQVVKSYDAVKARTAQKAASTSLALDTRSLSRGTYFLHVTYGKDAPIKSQIILD